MNSYTDLLIERFAGRGLLIDTNLLLLYVVGQFDQNILLKGSFDRLAAYSLEDYQLLSGLISLFATCVTTPHVLTEVSNWIGYLSNDQEIECLAGFPKSLTSFTELKTDSFELSEEPHFRFIGLTDTALASFANDYLIVTDDARFVFHLNKLEREALNINHLRQELWLLG